MNITSQHKRMGPPLSKMFEVHEMGKGPTHSDSGTKTPSDQGCGTGNGLSILEFKHKIPNASHQGKKKPRKIDHTS